MASTLFNAGKDIAMDAVAAQAGFVSLHTAEPDATGSDEVTGGSPAYARKAITWNASSLGQVTNSNSPTFDVPAGTTITYVGVWDSVSGGTILGKGAITSESYVLQGTYQISSGSIGL